MQKPQTYNKKILIKPKTKDTHKRRPSRILTVGTQHHTAMINGRHAIRKPNTIFITVCGLRLHLIAVSSPAPPFVRGRTFVPEIGRRAPKGGLELRRFATGAMVVNTLYMRGSVWRWETFFNYDSWDKLAYKLEFCVEFGCDLMRSNELDINEFFFFLSSVGIVVVDVGVYEEVSEKWIFAGWYNIRWINNWCFFLMKASMGFIRGGFICRRWKLSP